MYYRAIVVARGPGSPEALELAELWQLGGQSEDAVAVLDRYIAAQSEISVVRDARKIRDQYQKGVTAFSSRIDLPSLDKDGDAMFQKGRKAYKKKQWGDALVYYHLGLALAPDLAGVLRELGATYKELNADDKRREFYLKYLWLRPFGDNADFVRKELKDEKDVLGTLTIETTFKCETALQMNRQQVPANMLGKPFKVAPGTGELGYDALCVSEKYEFGMWTHADVTAGGEAKLKFEWALIKNKLVKPFGRIKFEDPEDPTIMRDVGLADVFGIQVPPDGRSLKYIAVDDLGEKTKEAFIKLVPGQTYEIKW